MQMVIARDCMMVITLVHLAFEASLSDEGCFSPLPWNRFHIAMCSLEGRFNKLNNPDVTWTWRVVVGVNDSLGRPTPGVLALKGRKGNRPVYPWRLHPYCRYNPEYPEHIRLKKNGPIRPLGLACDSSSPSLNGDFSRFQTTTRQSLHAGKYPSVRSGGEGVFRSCSCEGGSPQGGSPRKNNERSRAFLKNCSTFSGGIYTA